MTAFLGKDLNFLLGVGVAGVLVGATGCSSGKGILVGEVAGKELGIALPKAGGLEGGVLSLINQRSNKVIS